MKTINLQKVAVGLLCCSFVFFTSCSKDDTLDKLQQEVETMKKKQDEEAQKRKLKEEADKKKQQEEAEQKKKQDEENKQKQEEEKQKQEEKEKQREAEEQKRQEAEKQRQEAEQKRQEAERQRQEAEQKRKEAEQKREQAGKKPEKAQGLTFSPASPVKIRPNTPKAIDIVGGKAPYSIKSKMPNMVRVQTYPNQDYFSITGLYGGETEIEVSDSAGKTGVLKVTVGY